MFIKLACLTQSQSLVVNASALLYMLLASHAMIRAPPLPANRKVSGAGFWLCTLVKKHLIVVVINWETYWCEPLF